ncbi:hypothetical protein HDU93_002647 [Gonapodya sp. JEL0774]|nr:hypothetical protein HDU93_002647 [Gonapodya sp. JEL0774]
MATPVAPASTVSLSTSVNDAAPSGVKDQPAAGVKWILVGIGAGGGLLVVVAFIAGFFLIRRRSRALKATQVDSKNDGKQGLTRPESPSESFSTIDGHELPPRYHTASPGPQSPVIPPVDLGPPLRKIPIKKLPTDPTLLLRDQSRLGRRTSFNGNGSPNPNERNIPSAMSSNLGEGPRIAMSPLRMVSPHTPPSSPGLSPVIGPRPLRPSALSSPPLSPLGLGVERRNSSPAGRVTSPVGEKHRPALPVYQTIDSAKRKTSLDRMPTQNSSTSGPETREDLSSVELSSDGERPANESGTLTRSNLATAVERARSGPVVLERTPSMENFRAKVMGLPLPYPDLEEKKQGTKTKRRPSEARKPSEGKIKALLPPFPSTSIEDFKATLGNISTPSVENLRARFKRLPRTGTGSSSISSASHSIILPPLSAISSISSISGDSLPEPKGYTVTIPYESTKSDELTCLVGHHVLVKVFGINTQTSADSSPLQKWFDDGWVQAANVNTGLEGFVPMGVLKPLDDVGDELERLSEKASEFGESEVGDDDADLEQGTVSRMSRVEIHITDGLVGVTVEETLDAMLSSMDVNAGEYEKFRASLETQRRVQKSLSFVKESSGRSSPLSKDFPPSPTGERPRQAPVISDSEEDELEKLPRPAQPVRTVTF